MIWLLAWQFIVIFWASWLHGDTIAGGEYISNRLKILLAFGEVGIVGVFVYLLLAFDKMALNQAGAVLMLLPGMRSFGDYLKAWKMGQHYTYLGKGPWDTTLKWIKKNFSIPPLVVRLILLSAGIGGALMMIDVI